VWPATGPPETKGIVRLGAHLLRGDEEEVGESAEITFVTRAPEQSGAYIIEFDLAAEHVTWFEDFGPGVLRHDLTVQ
jgi:hypothetical protein